ncbi:MAG: hypothetical protein HOZ81_06980 [Streptomyces sp.]|nr:hypothetical protein [Streptomyces sp.]
MSTAVGLLELVDEARPGERVEVFARRTETALMERALTTMNALWQIEVRSAVGDEFGASITQDPAVPAVRAALAAARRVRSLAPARERRNAAPAPLAIHPVHDDAGPDLDGLSALLDRIDEETVLAADGITTTFLADSTGRHGSYQRRESQLLIRGRGAMGASLAGDLTGLRVEEARAEFRFASETLRLPEAEAESLDWILLAPLATAQVLSSVSPLVCAEQEWPSEMIASPAVTLVDDGTLREGPATTPFDDNGVPRRRTVVIKDGRPGTLLGASTGNSRRGDWTTGTTIRPTTMYLRPSTGAHPEPAAPPGTGLHVDAVTGLRARGRIANARVQLGLSGRVIEDGVPLGSAAMRLDVTLPELLRSVVRVHGLPRFYRINGVFGGSSCLLQGLPLTRAPGRVLGGR